MKKDKPYQGKIPLERKSDGTVSLCHYFNESWDWANKNTDLVDNFIFEDTLHYVDYSTGRSSVLFEFQSEKGDSYGMFLSEFNKLLQDHREVWNLDGKWTFVKRGANYGIKYIGGRSQKIYCDGKCGTYDVIDKFHIDNDVGTDSYGRDTPDFLCDVCWGKRQKEKRK